jgi:hypothetical protein
MPWFDEFQSAYGGRGFAVIGVSLDDGGWAAVRPFLERTKIAYPIVIGDHALAQRFGGASAASSLFLIRY